MERTQGKSRGKQRPVAVFSVQTCNRLIGIINLAVRNIVFNEVTTQDDPISAEKLWEEVQN